MSGLLDGLVRVKAPACRGSRKGLFLVTPLASNQWIAQVAYAANAEYARCLGENAVPWDEAEETDRAMWVAMTAFLLRCPYCGLGRIQEEWLRLEKEAGWSHGQTLDNAAKRHPYHVPWSSLPPEQARKNELFVAIVRSMRKALS